MLLEDALKALFVDRAIPGAIGIDDEPRAAGADAEARGLCPHRTQARLADALFHILPHALAVARRAAVRSNAEKKMPLGAVDAGLREAVLKWGAHAGRLNHEGREEREDFRLSDIAKFFVLSAPFMVQMRGL